MTINDAQSVLNKVKWTEEALYLKEFLHKHKLPRIARLVKGQYQNLGVPSLSSPSLCQNVLLVNLGKRKRLLAQCVRYKDNRKIVPVGQKIAVPPEYTGFFEILSEDGRCVKCIESVAELCLRFPESVLVRDNLKAFVSKSDDIDTIRDKSRVIGEGEVLILVGEVMGVKGKVQNRYLRCFDGNGENVYLPFDLKSKFSAIAKEDNISGVHTASNLLNKRLPLMVRLAHGKWPRGVKSTSSFAPEMRLLTVIEEDFIVALTLNNRDCQVVPLPQMSLIKLQTVQQDKREFSQMPEVDRLVDRCHDLSSAFMDEMTIHDIAYSRDIRLHGTEKGVSSSTYQRRRVKRNSLKLELVAPTTHNNNNNNNGKVSPKDDYDEIEQIYDYVRGFAPLPRSAKGWQYENKLQQQQQQLQEQQHLKQQQQTPPEPPPIETIPTTRPPQRTTSLDFSPPGTPPVSAPWETFNHQDLCNKPANHLIPDFGTKKRQRNRMSAAGGGGTGAVVGTPGGADENIYAGSTRFVKSAYQNRQIGQKHRFFKHRFSSSKDLGSSNYACTNNNSNYFTLSRSNLYSPLPAGNNSSNNNNNNKGSSPASFFQLRYKSMTNLAYAEYDTLDSSNSGGKTSGDSGGSRTLPEKRSRHLSRPKSLTNLVWGIPNSSRYSSMSINKENNNNNNNVYASVPVVPNNKHVVRPTTANVTVHHSNKMGTVTGSGSKNLGTLYL